MNNTQVMTLIDELIAAQRNAAEVATTLTSEQLDTVITLRDLQRPLRFLVYQMVVHPREHLVHLQKVLQKTGTEAPNEGQMIMGEAAESLGAFLGLFYRMTDDDLDRDFEGHTPRSVLQHLRQAHELYAQFMENVKVQTPAA